VKSVCLRAQALLRWRVEDCRRQNWMWRRVEDGVRPGAGHTTWNRARPVEVLRGLGWGVQVGSLQEEPAQLCCVMYL